MKSQQIGLRAQDPLYMEIHSSSRQRVISHILCNTHI